MRTRICYLLALLLLAAAALAAPRNVILMIGDGMGPDSVYAAGAYKFGAAYHRFGGKERLTMETLKGHVYVTTFSADGKGYDFTWAGGDREYVKKGATDSAAAATAMSTGVKTYDAAIGVDPKKQKLTTMVELAHRHGMRAGVITSVPFSHATPAGFASHNENRNNYAAIAHDMLFNVKPEVVMGGGNPEAPAPNPYEYIGKDDWTLLRDGKTDYTVLQDRAAFQRLMVAPRCGKVFGLFKTHSNMKLCNADRQSADPTLPTLAEMAEGTLETLDNKNGFFLMIEGGSIDWANHADDLNGSIGETLAFDETIATVLKWIEKHGGWKQNLLIITADHDTGYMNSVKPTEKGKLPLVQWGMDGKGWTSHTNRPVDCFFQGADDKRLDKLAKPAQDFERGAVRIIDDTYIFRAIDAALKPYGNRPMAPETCSAAPGS